mmetsp:Transcript_119582/g.371732  ORF Transcript_119582/g.371732 Transcript_119582/m.371732 type:complete len:521 (+) Transcript_119582:100-1662(+)
MEAVDLKAQRAAERTRAMSKKQAQLDRARAARSQPQRCPAAPTAASSRKQRRPGHRKSGRRVQLPPVTSEDVCGSLGLDPGDVGVGSRASEVRPFDADQVDVRDCWGRNMEGCDGRAPQLPSASDPQPMGHCEGEAPQPTQPDEEASTDTTSSGQAAAHALLCEGRQASGPEGAIQPVMLDSLTSVEGILAALAEDLADASLQAAGFQALDSLLSATPSRALEVAAPGRVWVLTRAMEEHLHSEAMQELGCKLLRVIAVCNGDCRACVAQAGGVQVVVAAMRAHRSSVGVQEAGCHAFKELAAHNAALQQEISASAGIEEVIGTMEMHTSIARVQVAACGVLRNVAVGSTGLQAKIAALGGVQAVFAAMELHRADALVQWAGCWALFCLAFKNGAVQGQVAASGGIPAVLRAMRGHLAVPQVQEAGCWALGALARASEPSPTLAESIQAASAAMREHGLAAVQTAGRAALRKLIAHGASCRTRPGLPQGCRVAQARQHVRPSIAKKRHMSSGLGLPTIQE